MKYYPDITEEDRVIAALKGIPIFCLGREYTIPTNDISYIFYFTELNHAVIYHISELISGRYELAIYTQADLLTASMQLTQIMKGDDCDMHRELCNREARIRGIKLKT